MPDFSKKPYFDDFQEDNNHNKVLFHAGRPVQARELNQIQSITHKQIDAMAGNLFKNGTRISGGTVTFNNLSWVRLNMGADLSWFIKESIAVGVGSGQGDGSGTEARIIAVSEETETDPATLFVVYEKTAIDGETISFIEGEQLKIISSDRSVELTDASNRPNVRCPSCPDNNDNIDSDTTIAPMGNKARQMVVEEGVWHWNGWFINSPRMEYIYSKYDEKITAKIGFDVIETIVTHDEDSSLLDNALGYPNETAPGADRYKIDMVLNNRRDVPQDGEKFIILCEIEDGEIVSIVSDTQYNKIMDVMAQRTYEESGNYTVRPFSLKYIDHKASSEIDPTGGNVNGSEDYLRAIVSEGLAYVKGYRHEKNVNTVFDVKKARDTVKSEDGTIFFNEPSYVDLIVPNGANAWANNSDSSKNVFTDEWIELKNGALSGTTPNGSKVGVMKVWDVIFKGETSSNERIYRYYISDIRMNSGYNYSSVKSVGNISTNFAAKPVTTFKVINESNRNLFWNVSVPMIKSMRDVDNPDKGSIMLMRRIKLNATLNSSGAYTWDSTSNLFSSGTDSIILSVKDSGVWKTLDPTNRVNPSSNSVTVNLGSSFATREVMLVINAFAVNLVEKTKTLVEGEEITLESSDTNNFVDGMMLGKCDAIRLRSVLGDGGTDITDHFRLNTGQTPTAYRESFLENVIPIPQNKYNTIVVEFDYFSHSDTSQSGFFTIDSYSKIIDSDTNNYSYGNLPSVVGSDGSVYETSQIIDFRPMILDDTISTSYMPASGTTLIHDSEYYVPRKDYVCIDKDGNIFEQEGIPALKPEFPHQAPNTMILFKVLIPAYTYSYHDVKVTKVENKRYTMRDIGNLENRIDNLEYYSTLSLAEQSVANSSITDDNGMDRFKNGFIVDNFVNYSVADTANTEFRAIKDEIARALRPNTGMFNRQLVLDESKSSNYKMRGGVITLPYTHVQIDEQPFATKSVSINECFLSKKIGELKLSPNNNTWSDINREAKQEWTIDTGVDAIMGLSNQINKVQKDFNDFQVANATVTTPVSGVNVSTRTRIENRVNSSTVRNRSSIATTTTSQTIRTTSGNATVSYEQSKISPKTTNYSFDRVTDVQITPYMKETTIRFYASGLLPFTKVYVFFDDKNVTGFASTMNFSSVDGSLSTNEKGEVSGVLYIPSGMFLNGTKVVKISNDKTNSGDEDMEMCVATAQFYAGGLSVSKQEIDMNIVSPSLSTVQVNYSQAIPSSTTSSVVTNTTIRQRVSSRRSNDDPVAQSFTLNKDGFISKIDLFFHEKDRNIYDNIFVEIRKMENGYPSAKQILAHKEYRIQDINTSEDASVATTIEFDTPVFVNSNEEHCFVVGGYSPLTKLWVSKVGGQAINYGNKYVDTQPSLGSRFRSQNGRTWNAEQFEDVMYKLYVAKFDSNPMNLTFKLKEDDEENELLHANPFECEQGSNLIRVYTQNGHGLIKNDKVVISTSEGKWIRVKLNNGKVVSGHTLTTEDGDSVKVNQVQYPDIDKTIADICISRVKGNVKDGDVFVSDTFNAKDFDKVEFINGEVNDYVVPICGGSIISGLDELNGEINGIPLGEINREHTVVDVDDSLSFIIRVDTLASSTGRFGLNGVSANISRKFEMCNLSGSVMIYDGEEEWTFKALKHGDASGVFANDNYGYGDTYLIQRNENVFTDRPYKVASRINEKAFASGKSSIEYNAVLRRNINSEYVSPIINVDTLSVTLLSNHISWKNDESAKAPNMSDSYNTEYHPYKGSELYKYVSKTITLDEPASDLKIWFDVNKPLNTDFDVYIKTSETSGQGIDDKEWMLLENYNKDVVHNDIDDFSEIEILTNEVLSTPLPLFSACKIKIVGRSKNSAKYPLFKALRVIALT